VVAVAVAAGRKEGQHLTFMQQRVNFFFVLSSSLK
jgi:hypothetical protein